MTVEEQLRTKGETPLSAYLELTKPGIALFVTITAGVAYAVSGAPALDWLLLFHVTFGVYLSTSGALALNQVLEQGRDGLMDRTQNRPIPSGRIPSTYALAFGSFLLVAGLGHLWFWTGLLPAALTLLSAVLYNGVYTPLKKVNSVATLIGAVPGALPALIGWSAYDGTINRSGWALFGILFFWQLIHVLALGWNLREDYAKAGIQLIPPGDSSKLIGLLMVVSSGLLIPVSVAPTAFGMTGTTYAAGAVLLGGAMLAASITFLVKPTRQGCKRVFLGSLLYHPLLLGIMVATVFWTP